MVDVARLQVEVDSRDVKRAEDSFNRFSRSGRKAERQSKSVANQSQRTARAMQGMNRSVKLLTGAMGALTAALSVRALQQFVVTSVNAVDQIGKAAQTAGVAAENLQELRFAFSQLAGTTDREVDQSLRRFNRRLGLAIDGGGAAKDTFDDLGIALTDVSDSARDSDQVLNDLLIELGGIEDASRRAALASQAFGEDAGPRLAAALAGGIDSLREARQEARDLGLVLSDEAVQAGEDLADQFDVLSRQMGVQFQRAVVENKEQILALVGAFTDLIDAASRGDVLPDFFSRAEESASGFVTELEKAGRILLSLAGARTGATLGRAGGPFGSIAGAVGGGTAGFFTPEIAGLMMEIEGQEATLGEVDKQIRSLREREQELVSQMAPSSLSGQRLPASQMSELNLIRKELREIEALRNQLDSGRGARNSGGSQADLITGPQNLPHVNLIQDMEFSGAQDSFSGIEKSVQQITDELPTFDKMMLSIGDSVRDVAGTIEDGIGNALEDLIVRGESASDVFKQLAQDISAAILRQQVIDPFAQAATTAITGLFPGGGATGGQAASTSQIQNMSFLPGRANGGNVHDGRPYMVGERGPELFVPGQDGRISPNSAMGGGSVTVNIINEGGEQLEQKQTQRRRGPNGEQTIDVMVKSSMERLDSQGQLDGIFRRHGARRQGQR